MGDKSPKDKEKRKKKQDKKPAALPSIAPKPSTPEKKKGG